MQLGSTLALETELISVWELMMVLGRSHGWPECLLTNYLCCEWLEARFAVWAAPSKAGARQKTRKSIEYTSQGSSLLIYRPRAPVSSTSELVCRTARHPGANTTSVRRRGSSPIRRSYRKLNLQRQMVTC